jgi:hypothetical protein
VKIVITGFSNSGKTTVFNALTGLNLETTSYPTAISKDIKPHSGIVKVSDERLERLSSVFKPRKTTHATLEYIDYPGIVSPATGSDASQNSMVFDLIKDSDAILHVVRVFEDESVIYPTGEVEPLRDVRSFETELILRDLEFIEKRLERIAEQAKKGKRPDEADREFLLKCKEALEDEISLGDVEFTEAEKRFMLPYQFLTTMPEIVVLNIDERDINSDRAGSMKEQIEGYFKGKGRGSVPPVLALCGKIEMEITQLPEEERGEFFDDMGIDEPAMNKLCRVSYEALGLITFFTVIKDEVRAWTVKQGSNALKAAGKIHSDIERGFIKAEVVSYEDFFSCGEDMHRARERGLLRLEGKDYILRDGDIINFKFNI